MMTTPATTQQVQAAFQVLRKSIDATGWGGWVKDSDLMGEAKQVADAVVAAAPVPKPQPTPQPAPAPKPVAAPSPTESASTSKGDQK